MVVAVRRVVRAVHEFRVVSTQINVLQNGSTNIIVNLTKFNKLRLQINVSNHFARSQEKQKIWIDD